MTTDQKLERAISSRLANAAAIISAARNSGLKLSVACASLEKESSGRNVFGGDPWNQSVYPRGPALFDSWKESPVTRAKYTVYKMRRALGMQPNGVGPCQLTSVGLQIDAQKAGGCWKPYPNMLIGFRFLKGLIDEFGVQLGFQHYNGSGPAAEAYGRESLQQVNEWHTRLEEALHV